MINEEANIKYIGIRPGEKIDECMISKNEAYKTLNCKNYFIICEYNDLEKYIKNYKTDFLSIRKEYEDYNSKDNELIDNKELKILLEEY